MFMPAPKWLLPALCSLVPLLAGFAAGADEPRAVQFGLEAGGGFAGLELEDFAKAASDNTGTLTTGGWNGGARALVQLSMGLGVSVGYAMDGGGRYENTISGYNKKKGTIITRTIVASYEQVVYPVSVHFRTTTGPVTLGGELGVDLTTGTVSYTEMDNQGDSLRGNLAKKGMGYHAAAEGAVKVVGGLSVYLKLGWSLLSLDGFTGTVDENGVMKPEMLFMVRDTGSNLEQLEVSTSNSLTSTDHRTAKVAGAGIRITGGLRWMF